MILQHNPPEAIPQQTYLDDTDRAMVDAAIRDYHARVAPTVLQRIDWSEEMRETLARQLVAMTEWHTPDANGRTYSRLLREDLQIVTELAWFCEVGHGVVREMRDEHLATLGALARELEASERSDAITRQRLAFYIAVQWRSRAHGYRRTIRTHAPRRRGAGRPRAQATRSSVRSGDSGDPDPDADPPGRSGELRNVSEILACELCTLDSVELNYRATAGGVWTCLTCHVEAVR